MPLIERSLRIMPKVNKDHDYGKDLVVEQSIVVDAKARKRQCVMDITVVFSRWYGVENASAGYVAAQISSLASDKLRRRNWREWQRKPDAIAEIISKDTHPLQVLQAMPINCRPTVIAFQHEAASRSPSLRHSVF